MMESLTPWTSVLDSHHRMSVVGHWSLATGPCPIISSGKLATTTNNLIHDSDRS
ncbi:hypothetical protein BYT27DRAFT_7197706 [Phlegmacium glaucopus]|nr:hypothetical protein BYT27DRAFT_7197706 [Phlegmacium glaucopus]